MFAIVSTGGKQYKVAEETVLTVNKLEGSDGDKVTLDEVLFASDGKNFALGNPQIDGAKVNAEIVTKLGLDTELTQKHFSLRIQPKNLKLRKLLQIIYYH